MEILTSVRRLYISFKSPVNDFVYSFGRAALLLLIDVQNHTVPVRERGRIRVIRNKLQFHSGLYVYFVQNIRILHSNMIQFHKYEIKSSASHFTLIINRHCQILTSRSISPKASVVQLTMPVSSAQNWNKFSANHHADLKNCHRLPILSLTTETNISSFSFLLEMVCHHKSASSVLSR